MKKLLSIIIALATLLLVSCASTTPAESAEPSWITSIISTTASAAATLAPWTSAEPTVYTHTEATTATTATTSTQGAITPTSPFVPSGYTRSSNNAVETKSKIILADYTSYESHGLKATYYYSKADGEFYPFCFDPFCEHKPYTPGSSSISCIGKVICTESKKNQIYYYNSRIFFVLDGTIYSCSEFATDLRKEVVMEDLSYLSKEEYQKRRKQNGGIIIYKFQGDAGSLFFEYVDPDGKVIWYRYNTETRKLINMTEKIDAAAKKMGIVLYPEEFAGGHIFMFGGKSDSTVSLNYVADYELNDIRVYDNYGILVTLFKTNDGLVMYGFYKDGVYESSPDVDYASRSFVIPNNRNYDIFLLKTDGTTETLVKNARKTFGFKNTEVLYMNDKYLYFCNNIYEKIGVEWLSLIKTAQDVMASYDGKIYRYDLKTGEVDMFFESVGDFCDVRKIDYISEKDSVAIINTQYYVDQNNIIYGFEEYTVETYIIKCHLDENGVVDGYEIVDFSEI